MKPDLDSPLGVIDSVDTIAAIASGGGGAIALVRVSGPDAHAIAARMLEPAPAHPRTATLVRVYHPDSRELLDEAIAIRYDADASYTGEPMLEISTHGGPAVPVSVLGALLAAGARVAEAGEFTRRAVLNGKLDLARAEAVGELVSARTRAMQRAALSQLGGALTRAVSNLRESLLGVEALIAYDIDFPGEDDGPISIDQVLTQCDRTLRALEALLAAAPVAALVRDGAIVVLAGAPNAGKSSLFNALLGEARAIVTEHPGTTRDAVDALLDSEPWPIRLVDTAGLRASDDPVERLGVEVSERWLGRADVVLVCGESEDLMSRAAQAVAAISEAPIVRVRTKCDLGEGAGDSGVSRSSDAPDGSVLHVSASTGQGLTAVIAEVQRVIGERQAPPAHDAPLLVRERQRHAVETARDELALFRDAWARSALPAPVAAVHLGAAAHALEEIIGAVSTDDVLDRVFSTFCVGK